MLGHSQAHELSPHLVFQCILDHVYQSMVQQGLLYGISVSILEFSLGNWKYKGRDC